MANLDDILTTLKNIPTQLSALSSAWRRGQGNITTQTFDPGTFVLHQICTGSGRLVSARVVQPGATDFAYVYDVIQATGTISVTSLLFEVPKTEGYYQIDAEFKNGLLLLHGAGNYCNFTYYQGP